MVQADIIIATPTAFSPVDENIALTAAIRAHIEITTNGGDEWSYFGNGLTGAKAGHGFNSIGWDANDPDRFALFLTDHGTVLTEDYGSVFRNLKIPSTYTGTRTTPVGALDPTPASKLIIAAIGKSSYDGSVLARSDDGGITWTKITGTEGAYRFIAFHPQSTNIIYAGNMKSIDSGKSWNLLSKEIVAIYAGNGDIVYSAKVNNQNKVLIIEKSVDGGTNWTRPYDPITNITYLPEGFCVDTTDQDRIYIALKKGVLIWNGSNWELKTDADGLEKDWFGSLRVGHITVDPKHPNVVYAGKTLRTEGHTNGIFRSIDYGKTWKNITYNLGPEFTATAISVNPHNGYVFISSNLGTWRLPPLYNQPAPPSGFHINWSS